MNKVLHLINGEHYAGAERVQDLLGQYLPEYGYEAGFVCLKHGQFEDKRHGRDTPLFNAPMRFRGDVRPVLLISSMFKTGDYRLLHTHTPRTALIGAACARLNATPMVHHVHSPTDECTESVLRNTLVAATEKLSLRQATRLVAVSRSVQAYLHRLGLCESKMRLVPNGVPSPPMLSRRPAPSGSGWTVGTIALFRPRKGLEILLRAVRELLDGGVELRLRAIGGFETPEYERQIRELCANLDLEPAVEFTGFRSDVLAELHQLDLFAMPSLSGEGLPMVVLEAMAAGVPVVATRVQGIPEAIEDDVSGILVEPDDAHAFAAAMGMLIKGERDWNQLRTAAFDRQTKLFSATAMASAVAGVYDELLG